MRLKHTLKRGIAAAVIAGITVSSGLPVLAETYYINDGSVTITATAEGKNNVTQEKAATQDLDTELAANEDETTIKGGTEASKGSDWETATKNTVKITNDHEGTTTKVTLDNVTIETSGAAVSVSGKGNVSIELDGKSNLKSGGTSAGIQKNSTGELKITDDRNNDGTEKVTAGDKDTGELTVTGGSSGSYGGAGIGGASGSSADSIAITGGKITAYGGSRAAGIGGGRGGYGTNIEITGGEVTATGGNDPSMSSYGGAGIGGGSQKESKVAVDTDSIKILGGIVKAFGGGCAAGIGGGRYHAANVEISGEGTQVEATGGKNAAGIGSGGFMGSDGNTDGITKIIISAGSKVKAWGGNLAAAIGGGYGASKYNSGAEISISGKDTEVKAYGNESGPSTAIGSGYRDKQTSADNQKTTVSISGGTVTADGQQDAIGIGAYKDDSSSVSITGGTVTATGSSGITAGKVTINADDDNLELTAEATMAASGAIQSGEKKDEEAVTSESLGEKHTGIVTLYTMNHALQAIIHNTKYIVENHLTTENYVKGDAKNAHSWEVQSVTKEATCTTPGEIVYQCAVCGATTTAEIPATGHDFGEWAVTKEATCTEAGEENRTCSKGDKTETREISAKGHTAKSERVNVRAATCTEDGYTGDVVCDTCGVVLEAGEKIPATGHDFGEWIVTKEAACTEAGEEIRTCSKGDATEKRETPATGHEFGEWVVTKEATVSEEGEEARTCEKCGAAETRAIAKLTPAPTPDPKPAPDPVPDPKPTPDPKPSVPDVPDKDTPTEKPDETPAWNESEVTVAQPKLRLLDSSRTDILGNTEEVEQVFDAEEQTLTIRTDRTVADLTGTLELLDQMRTQGVKQIVLKTQNRTSVLLLDEICAVGGPDAEFSLTHNGTEATLLINGVFRPELIH